MKLYQVEIVKDIVKGFQTDVYKIKANSKEEAINKINAIIDEEEGEEFGYLEDTFYDIHHTETINEEASEINSINPL